MRKNRIKFIGVGIAICLCAVIGIALLTAASSDSREAKEAVPITEAIGGYLETVRLNGHFSTQTGYERDLSAREEQDNIAWYHKEVDKYTTADSFLNEIHKYNYEQSIKLDLDTMDYVVDTGILEITLEELSFSKDGNKATVQAKIVGWTKMIYEVQEPALEGKLFLSHPIGRYRQGFELTKENGTWKIAETTGVEVIEPTEDIYKKLENNIDKASPEEYVKELQEGFDSFGEAIDAAEKLDMEAMNPY